MNLCRMIKTAIGNSRFTLTTELEMSCACLACDSPSLYVANVIIYTAPLDLDYNSYARVSNSSSREAEIKVNVAMYCCAVQQQPRAAQQRKH